MQLSPLARVEAPAQLEAASNIQKDRIQCDIVIVMNVMTIHRHIEFCLLLSSSFLETKAVFLRKKCQTVDHSQPTQHILKTSKTYYLF